MNERPLPTILSAEDEESDRLFMKVAFRKANIPHPLMLVADGQEAVEYLSGTGRYADRAAHPLPGLILLDLKMPRMSGFDVLAWLGKHPEFKGVPAVVLSSSADASDRGKARQLGAREYFVKPHSIDKWVEISREMQTRWLSGPDRGGN